MFVIIISSSLRLNSVLSFLQSEYLSEVCGGLFNIFLSNVYHSIDSIPTLKPSDIAPFLDVLETLQTTGLLARFDVDVSTRVDTLRERVKVVAHEHYQDKSAELFGAPGVNKALPLLLLTDTLEKVALNLDKRFPQPLLGSVHTFIGHLKSLAI